MNYYLLSFLVIVLPYTIISIYQDIKTRKVNNLINLTFLYISFLSFIFFLVQYNIFDYLIIIGGSYLAYYFYKKHFWGGADGKIFIGLTLLILAFGNKYFYLYFLVNISVLYSIKIIILVIIRTSLKQKLKVAKKIDYGIYIFQILIIYIVIKSFLYRLVSPNSIYFSYLIIVVFVLVKYSNKYIKLLYSKLNILQLKIGINLLLFILLFLISKDSVLKFFFIILAFRIAMEFISEMTNKIKSDKELYQSPFSIYLFFSAIFTMIGQANIIDVILKFFI
ncbi:MAG: hypothetical protein PF569_09765 [Candidatus Woesearchaeota archaeon]|jgi:Flp pilus assembly protein protease CpaA|nr:hypothetical protein [Candidatus Woesearchaeota archaeon]